VVEPGEAKVKGAVVPVTPVRGLDADKTLTVVVSEAQLELEPL
jgi:hypothetical protein